MKFLLDTNIISETIKPNPHIKLKAFFDKVSANNLYTSVLCFGEIRKGIEKLDHSQTKRQALQLWLERDLMQYYSGRILPINIDVANKWGSLIGGSKDPLPAIDSLIAATAICFNLILVTRNTKDFDRFPIETFNPLIGVTEATY